MGEQKQFRRSTNRSVENSLSAEERRVFVDWFLAKYGCAERLFLAKCRRFTKMLCDKGHWAEIAGQCFLGLARAAELFDPTRGVQFDTFALPHQYRFCQSLLYQAEKDEERLNGRIVVDGDTLDEWFARSADPAESVDREDLRAEVRRLLYWHATTPKQRETVKARFPTSGKRLTHTKMGEKHGVTRGAAWQRGKHLVQQAIRWGLTPEKAGRMLGVL